MDEWEINKSLGQCFGTGKQIEYDEEYFATLIETKGQFERRDFCAEYWQDQSPQVFCYWKTKRPNPERKQQLFVDEEMLVTFFNRLETEAEQEKINFRFVLALILMRKRRLKYESSRSDDGKEIWRLRVTGGDKQFVDVVNPNLGEEQIEDLSSNLGQILQVEL